MVFCDLFAGTGIVGRTFAPLCKSVIANDLEYYSFVVNRGYLTGRKDENAIITLNNIEGKEGKLTTRYTNEGKLYFTPENSKKIDAIRESLEQYKEDEGLYYYLLACLLEEADAVANVASVYGAFLKKYKKSAQKPLVLSGLEIPEQKNNRVYNKNANELIKEISGDILYLDPPYNGREYGANYHILNTIAKYDDFVPKGKTGLREYTKSAYCKKAQVKEALRELIRDAKFKYIFMSYNNEGLLTLEEIREVFSEFGTYEVAQREYNRFSSHTGEEKQKTTEYIHILTKE